MRSGWRHNSGNPEEIPSINKLAIHGSYVLRGKDGQPVVTVERKIAAAVLVLPWYA